MSGNTEAFANEEIKEKFGIDGKMPKNLMRKEKTEIGVKIRWEEPNVS